MDDVLGLGKTAKHLAPVVNNLINRVSDATGVLYEPTHVRRMARAEAEAKLVLAGAQNLSALQKRAIQRMLHEEERKQANIELAISQAIPHLNENAKPEAIDTDWLFEYLDRIKKISDEQLRTLWAKILAGEANRPGSFSKATLHAISIIEKKDAELFARLCKFTVWLDGEEPRPFVWNLDDNIYQSNGVTFHILNHLEDIGLVSLDPHGGYSLGNLGPETPAHYGSEPLTLCMPHARSSLPVGHLILTDVGVRLIRLAGVDQIDGYLEYMAYYLKRSNTTLVSEYGPIVARDAVPGVGPLKS